MNATLHNKHIQTMISGFRKLAARHENIVRIDAGERGVTFAMDNGGERLTYSAKDADIQIAGETAVMLGELVQYAKIRNTSGDAVINSTGDQALIRYMKAGVELEHPLTLAPIPEYDAIPAKGKLVAPGFIQLLQRAFVCASSDITRPTLHGAYLDITNGDHRIVCTDGKRLSAFTCKLPIKRSAIIPVTKILTWPRLSGDTAMAVSNDMFRLDVGSWVYSGKLIEGAFPDWRAVVPEQAGAQQMILSGEQRDALMKLITELPGKKDEAVGLCMRSGLLAVCMQKAGGAGYNVIPAGPRNGKADFPAVFVCRQMLLDALHTGFTSFSYAGESAPLVSRTPEGHLHVLMPFRSDEDDRKQVGQVTARIAGVRVTEKAKKTEQQKKGITAMKQEQTIKQDEGSAIDRLQETYRLARERVKEANSALGDVAALLREVVKEDKLRRSEIKQVRAGLSKLQAIRV